jgi:hypothetical protein
MRKYELYAGIMAQIGAVIIDPLLDSGTLPDDAVQTSTWYDREPVAEINCDFSDD